MLRQLKVRMQIKNQKSILFILLVLPSLSGTRVVLWDRDLPKFATKSAILNTVVAKELCSGQWLASIPVCECIVRGNLPNNAMKVDSVTADEKNAVRSWTGRLGDLQRRSPRIRLLHSPRPADHHSHAIAFGKVLSTFPKNQSTIRGFFNRIIVAIAPLK